MKKVTLYTLLSVLLLLGSCSRYSVYSVQSRPNTKLSGGLLYALPYTQLQVAVTFEKTDYSKAPFSAYAEDLLGLPGESDSVYAIHSIEVQAQNIADPRRYYFVRPGGTKVNIDSRGLLRSVGLNPGGSKATNNAITPSSEPAQQTMAMASYNLYDRVDTFYTRGDKPGSPTLVSSKKDSRSARQRATAAAEEIQDIADKQQALLFGEYEANYDGDALRYIYNQLEQRRQQLLSQFTGVRTKETVIFTVNPKDEKTLIDNQTIELFRFTPQDGLVDSTVDALVVSCNIRCENTLRNATRFIKHRTKTVKRGNLLDRQTFKYIIPETAHVTLYGEDSEKRAFEFTKEVKIAQFGTIANLPAGRVKALFDPATGILISLDK